jgi:anti-sigma B factor antagonist
LEILEKPIGPADHLELSGDLDSFSVNVLRDRINRLFDQSRYNIVVDLTKVNFVDSAGLGQLVAALKMAVHHGGDVKLVKPNTSVQDLLRITKLETVFSSYESVDEAVNSFPK